MSEAMAQHLIYPTKDEEKPLTFCLGLSWWLSGKESICQWRRRGFDP